MQTDLLWLLEVAMKMVFHFSFFTYYSLLLIVLIGSLRSDIWRLQASGTASDSGNVLMWEKRIDLEMPTGRCAHGSAIVDNR